MKPTKEIIEKAARRGALLQNVQLIMWEFVKKRESDESVNWIEYAGKIVDVVEGKDTPEGKLISTYKDKLWDKNLELDPDDDTPKETWAKDNNCFEFKTIEDRDMFGVWIAKELTQAKAEGAREVIGEIQYRLDGAKQDVEMAEDPADPKVRINYFESVLATLREDYKLKEKV